MGEMKPTTFYKVLWYTFYGFAILGISNIIKDLGFVFFDFPTIMLSIRFYPPYNLIPVGVSAVCVVLAYWLGKKYKKVYKELVWRK